MFQVVPDPYRDGFNMRLALILAAVIGLSACSPASTAAGTIGGAAKGTVQTIGNWFK